MKKNVLRFILFSLIFIIANNEINAQMHSNLWTRLTINKSLKKSIKADLEFQHRSQNGFKNNNLFSNNLLNSIRTWIIYQPSKHWQYSISPFAYFYHYPIINQLVDENKPYVNEYRISGAVDYQYEIKQKIYLQNRTGIEYRFFKQPLRDVIRFREKIGIKKDFSSKWSAMLSNELLLNFYGVNKQHFFDHNRVGFLLQYKPLKTMKIEFGYTYISRLQRTAIEYIQENNFILNFTYLMQNKK
jgi:hypothetical protein